MYGYNIHSGMPTMHGGLTGYGMHSLGGYLLGGRFAKGVPLDEATKKKMYDSRHGQGSYEARLARLAQGLPATVKAPRVKKVRETQRMKLAHHLKRLVDAERMGAILESQSGHPELANYLAQDADYNEGVHGMDRYPAYVKRQFGLKTGARAKKGAVSYVYINKKGKPTVVKNGSAGYHRAILAGHELRPILPPQRRETYSMMGEDFDAANFEEL